MWRDGSHVPVCTECGTSTYKDEITSTLLELFAVRVDGVAGDLSCLITQGGAGKKRANKVTQRIAQKFI